MSYIVTLRSKKVVRVGDDEAWILKNSLIEAKNPIMVELGDDMVRSSEIVSVSKEQLTEADVLHDLDESKLIEAKGRCRGQFSIQHEINMLAFKQSKRISSINPEGLKWSKLIQDLRWREAMRMAMRAKKPEGWCDYKANECNCEVDYHSDAPRHLPDGVEVVASGVPLETRRDLV